METHRKKRIEIIAEAAIISRLLATVEEMGASGYTTQSLSGGRPWVIVRHDGGKDVRCVVLRLGWGPGNHAGVGVDGCARRPGQQAVVERLRRGLGIGGEVGQQLSYLVAAGVATTDFVLLLLIGYLYNHPTKAAALRDRFRNRRRRTA